MNVDSVLGGCPAMTINYGALEGEPMETLASATSFAILLLRLLLATLMAGHATQKLFGWFRGSGPSGTGRVFEAYGVRPGRQMAVFAGAAELLGAVLVVLGLAWPLGCAVVISTMVVAISVNAANGLWAHLGSGYEVALVYGAIAAVLGFSGPGAWSLDGLLFGATAHAGYFWGSAAIILGVVAALPLLVRRRLALRAEPLERR